MFVEWRAPFADCIAEAQASGEIGSEIEATEMAEFLLASWQGAILRMKVERNPRALERFKSIIRIGGEPSPDPRAVARAPDLR